MLAVGWSGTLVYPWWAGKRSSIHEWNTHPSVLLSPYLQLLARRLHLCWSTGSSR